MRFASTAFFGSLLALTACSVDVKDYRFARCDADHSCLDGRVCRAGHCVAASAGGGVGGSGGGAGGGSAVGGGGGFSVGGGTGGGGGHLGGGTGGGGVGGGAGGGSVGGGTGGGGGVGGGGTGGGGTDGGTGGGVGGGDAGCVECPLFQGVCAGAMNCGSGCSYPSTYEATEVTCGDGLDNDCDGIVDDVSGCILTLSGQAGPYRAADGSASARFATLGQLALGIDGHTLYAADTDNHLLRAVNVSLGSMSTVAGTGFCGGDDGPDASLCFPRGVAVGVDGTVYFTDFNRVRAWTDAGVVTLAGSADAGLVDATGAAARFNLPQGLAVLSNGDLLVVDTNNQRVRRVTTAGVVTTEAGGGDGGYEGPRATMRFNFPRGLTVASDGTWYLTENHLVRRVPVAGSSMTLAGSGAVGANNGSGSLAQFNQPQQLVLDEAGGRLFVADQNNQSVRVVPLDGGVTSSLWTASGFDTNIGFLDGPFSLVRADHPLGLAALGPGTLVLADQSSLRSVDLTAGVVTTMLGVTPAGASLDGPPGSATERSIDGLELLANGTVAFVQTDTHQVRLLSAAGTVMSVNAPQDAGFVNGLVSVAQFNAPRDLALDPNGRLLVADSLNHCVRAIDLTAGQVSTLSGGCTLAPGFINADLGTSTFGAVRALASSKRSGNDVLFINDRDNGVIRLVDYSANTVTNFAGTPSVLSAVGQAGGLGVGTLTSGTSVMVDDGQGGVFFGDANQLRRADSNGVLSTPAVMPANVLGLARSGTTLFVAFNRQVSSCDVSAPNVLTPLFGGGGGGGFGIGWHDGDAAAGQGLRFGGLQAGAGGALYVGDLFTLRRLWR